MAEFIWAVAYLFRMKLLFLGLAVVSLAAAFDLVHDARPGPTRREVVGNTTYSETDRVYPLAPYAGYFCGFGAVCVLAAAWAHTAESRRGGNLTRGTGSPAAEPSAAPDPGA